MGDRKIYIAARVFKQQGYIAYLCRSINGAHCLPETLEALGADSVQIITLGNPKVYSEYAPYTCIDSMKDFIGKVSLLNRVT